MDALAEALEALGKGGNDGTNKKGMHLPEDAGGHAARLWKFLDEMSERDPEAYAEFLEKQAVNAGVDSSKVKSMARQAAQPGKTVQQATDEALFGGVDAGKHTKASAAKAPDILYRPDRPGQHRASSEVVTRGEGTSSSGALSQRQRRGGREVEGSRPLITEMVAPEARLPEYEMTASHTSTSAACGDGDGSAHESFTIVVTAPELLHKSNGVAVDLVPGGVLVSIEGCKDLFVPLKGVHGNVAGSRGDDRSSTKPEDLWQARAKRSSKRGKLTISIEKLPPAAV